MLKNAGIEVSSLDQIDFEPMRAYKEEKKEKEAEERKAKPLEVRK